MGLLVLQSYVSTTEGKEALGQLANASQARFPQYWEEIEGIAEGSNVPRTMVRPICPALWHCGFHLRPADFSTSLLYQPIRYLPHGENKLVLAAWSQVSTSTSCS